MAGVWDFLVAREPFKFRAAMNLLRQRSAARILVVDDDESVRDCLALLLEEEGYEVHAAANPKAGLYELMANDWDLVLTDYSMPEHTGFWMLQEAERAGRLTCPAVIITALASQLPKTRFPVMAKPIEPDVLLTLCRQFAQREAPNAAPLELALYVTPQSLACARALETVRKYLEEQGHADKLEIVDLSRGGHDRAAADRVLFTPTLVRRRPTPVWIVGTPSPSVLSTLLV